MPEPKIDAFSVSTISVLVRQKTLDVLYAQYQRIYVKLEGGRDLAALHATEQELLLNKNENARTYKNAAAAIIVQLRRRDVADDVNELVAAGLVGDLQGRKRKRQEEEKYEVSTSQLEPLLLDHELMKQLDYPQCDTVVDNDLLLNQSMTKQCCRCKITFIPKSISVLSAYELIACKWHSGKLRRIEASKPGKAFSCCNEDLGAQGCQSSPHVFQYQTSVEYQTRFNFASYQQYCQDNSIMKSSAKAANKILSVDCEMAHTTLGMEVLRMSVVNEQLHTVLDCFVEPSGEVVDFNSIWSGITEQSWSQQKKVSLSEAQNGLFALMNANTVLMAHSLDSDLRGLRICHDRCIDTSVLFRHRNDLPYRYSLKFLVEKCLKRFIQETLLGHDSIEDASCTMELLLFRLQNPTFNVA